LVYSTRGMGVCQEKDSGLSCLFPYPFQSGEHFTGVLVSFGWVIAYGMVNNLGNIKRN